MLPSENEKVVARRGNGKPDGCEAKSTWPPFSNDASLRNDCFGLLFAFVRTIAFTPLSKKRLNGGFLDLVEFRHLHLTAAARALNDLPCTVIRELDYVAAIFIWTLDFHFRECIRAILEVSLGRLVSNSRGLLLKL